MPQSRARKQAYMRGYMRRRRVVFAKVSTSGSAPSYISPNRVVSPSRIRGNVSPSRTEVVFQLDPFGLERRPAQRLLAYMQALNRRGYTLALTPLGYELVDLATGEIGLRGLVPAVSPSTYEQHPSTRLLKESRLEERVSALEKLLTQHQADHIVQETQGSYEEA